LLEGGGGIANKKDVGVGVSVGVTMTGCPAATSPKRGWDIVSVANLFAASWSFCYGPVHVPNGLCGMVYVRV